MTSHPIDPRRLDVAAAARRGDALSGTWPLAGFARVVSMQHAGTDATTQPPVCWHVQGALRQRVGAPAEPELRLQATAYLRLQCQRCLEAVDREVQVGRVFRFVADEARAQAEDVASEDEVLALPAWLDLHELLEDELLLELPLAPRHEHCPRPAATALDGVPQQERKPFAALAALGKTERR